MHGSLYDSDACVHVVCSCHLGCNSFVVTVRCYWPSKLIPLAGHLSLEFPILVNQYSFLYPIWICWLLYQDMVAQKGLAIFSYPLCFFIRVYYCLLSYSTLH